MKKLLLLLLFSSCMINGDYHMHDLELNFLTKTLLTDGKEDGFTYEISSDNIGITFFIDEHIENFTWHYSVLNNLEIEVEIIDDEVFVNHDFNKYPQEIFKATTYLKQTNTHFIFNLD